MTEGSILRSLIFFAVPILIGNIFQQLYNVADAAIIGNILGDDTFAAVGAAAPVYSLIIGFASGLTNGFAVIVARHFGAGDEKSMKRAVAMTYLLSAAIAAVITMVGSIALHPLMKALKTPDEIIHNTESYMRIIILFSAVTITYNMLAGMMRAIGNSKAPLCFLMISTFINIGLDYLFIKGFGMGVAGAACATVISQGLSVALCFIYALKKCGFIVFSRKELVWNKVLFANLTSTGLSMGLMFAIVSAGSVILQGAVNSFGTATITAHTAARKIDEMFMMPMSTIALSASTFTSQNYGAGRIDRVQKGIRYSFLLTTVWSAFSVITALLLRRILIGAISGTADEQVISTASKYIAWNVTFFFVLGILVVLRSSLQGVGRKVVPVCGSAVELAMKIAASAYIAPKLGYFGICILEPAIWIICAVMVMVDYIVFLKRSGKAHSVTNKHAKEKEDPV